MKLKFRSVAEAIRAATALGATVEVDDAAINIDAPHGQLFCSTGTHAVVIPTEIWRASRRAEDIAADIAADFSHGFRACEDKHCEWCCGSGENND